MRLGDGPLSETESVACTMHVTGETPEAFCLVVQRKVVEKSEPQWVENLYLRIRGNESHTPICTLTTTTYKTCSLLSSSQAITRSYQSQSVYAWYKLLYSIVQVVRCCFGGRRQGIALSNTPTYDSDEFGLRPLTSETRYFYH